MKKPDRILDNIPAAARDEVIEHLLKGDRLRAVQALRLHGFILTVANKIVGNIMVEEGL